MPSGVPVAFPPFNTSPSTSKETCPVARLTLALPPTVLQGVVRGLIPPTASLLETVMLPTIVFQCTTASASWNWANAAVAENDKPIDADKYLICYQCSPALTPLSF